MEFVQKNRQMIFFLQVKTKGFYVHFNQWVQGMAYYTQLPIEGEKEFLRIQFASC